jgi:CDP-diacylglycerol--glycerol-3-phosphate 3-phosphatidyltransferase
MLRICSEVTRFDDELPPIVQETASEGSRGHSMIELVDVIFSSTVIAGFAGLGAAYTLRVWLQGALRYERIEQVGGSVLLSKRVMEMAYWGLQSVARACVSVGLTPNMITALTLVAATAAAGAAAMGHFGIALAALVVGTLGDALDGLVARISGRMSRAGAVFDSVADRYGEGVFLFGLGFYVHQSLPLLSLVFAAWMGSFMVSYVSAKVELLRVEAPRGLMRRTERAVYLTVATGITPYTQWLAGPERPGWVGLFPIIVALSLIAVIANISAVHRLMAIMQRLQTDDAQKLEEEAEEELPPSMSEPRRHAA